jgi:hypothetical protein
VAASTKPNPLTKDQQRFAYIVARGSGLSWKVVEAWVLAEQGPNGNPLNIGPGRDYGSPDKAAEATIKTLRDPRYKPVILSQKGSDTDQLRAIAASPWDANHYRGAGGSQGSLLLGTYKRVTGTPPPGISGTTLSIPGGPSVHVGGGDGILGGVENVGVKLLAYAVLSGVAVSLFVIGASRATGIAPAEFSALRADRRGAVPF